jgi:murein DD-endopeptidase MepM/ murein hydrolase activator NlpD
MTAAVLSTLLKRHQPEFHPVVPFDPTGERLYTLDLTESNTELSEENIADTEAFAGYINQVLHRHGARYGIGGYGEHRTLYARSKHFDREMVPSGARPVNLASVGTGNPVNVAGSSLAPAAGLRPAYGGALADEVEGESEPRRLHLGIDIWGPAGTKVMAPMDSIVHSFAFNNNDSDYGATLILSHNLEGVSFHTLYGHLSLNSIKNLYEGQRIQKGEVVAEFGMRFENGNWPPHLHFQVIEDMEHWKGDYPGVCRYSERERWLNNSPDPNLILQLQQAPDED